MKLSIGLFSIGVILILGPSFVFGRWTFDSAPMGLAAAFLGASIVAAWRKL